MKKEITLKNKLKQISAFISGLRTSVLVSIPFLSGMAIGVVAGTIRKQPYSGSPTDDAIALLILFLWGISGWVIFLRGDYSLPPPFKSIRGVHVRIMGLSMIIFFWGLCLLVLVKT